MTDCKHRNVTLMDDDGHRCILCYERFVPAKYFTNDKVSGKCENVIGNADYDAVGNEFKPVVSKVNGGGTG